MKNYRWIPFFAEEGAGAGGEGANGEGDQSKEPMTFDDVLKMDGMQAEFDRRISKGIATAVQNAVEKERERLNALHNDQLSEVEKLARMNEAEKNKYLEEKKQAEWAAREAALTKRELAASAKDTLSERGLPLRLADVLNYSNAEAVKASIDAIEAAFNAEVEARVGERLKGGRPPKDAETEGSSDKEKQRAFENAIAEAMGIRK